MRKIALLALGFMLIAGCGAAPRPGEYVTGVPSLGVQVTWPEQRLKDNAIHKMRVPRGGALDVVAVVHPNGVDLKKSTVTVTAAPALTPVKLLVDGIEAPVTDAVELEIAERKEVRWTFQLPWEPRVAEAEYRFDVVVSPTRRQRDGRTPGYDAPMKASVAVEQGVSCYDTTMKQRLMTLAESEYCKLEKIGRSAQGRDMYLLRVSDWSVPAKGKKQLIVIGPYHGNEPSGTETCLDFLYELLSRDDKRHYLQEMVFYVVPSHNPDGHEAGNHWGVHKIDPGNHAYKEMKIPEAVNVATALRKYKGDFTDAIAIVHHQWGRDYTLISHLDVVPVERSNSYGLIENMSVQVTNELDRPMYPIYGVQLEAYTGVRGFMLQELGIPNYTLENTSGRRGNLSSLMGGISTELAIYYATADQMLKPSRMEPRPHAPKQVEFPAERNYNVYRADEPPAIDGKLNDACWQSQTIVRDFRRIGRGGQEPPATLAYVAYDDKNLYVAFKAEQLGASTDPQQAGTAGIGSDDGCELMLDANLDQWSYCAFSVSADGALTVRHYSSPGISDSDGIETAGCKTAVSVQDGVVELSIPLAMFSHLEKTGSPLTLAPADGTVWGANFVRKAHGKVPESGWARTTNSTSLRPWEFNAVTFAGRSGN